MSPEFRYYVQYSFAINYEIIGGIGLDFGDGAGYGLLNCKMVEGCRQFTKE